jgi:hypothetical protein
MIAGIVQPFLDGANNRNLIVRGPIPVEGNQLVFHRDPGVLGNPLDHGEDRGPQSEMIEPAGAKVCSDGAHIDDGIGDDFSDFSKVCPLLRAIIQFLSYHFRGVLDEKQMLTETFV